MLDLSAVFIWSAWYLLEGCWRGQVIPQRAGLYRIRRTGRTDLDYIGQTGMGSMTLRQRLGMLAGVYASDMPYRDPHTAAPALWALRYQSGCTFEVAVVPVDGSTPYRKGLEALAIGLYRQQHSRSPTISFGRMPVGYRISSGNNRRLAESGQRGRGGPSGTIDDSHLPSQPPAGLLSANAVALDWCGHTWSPWMSIDRVTATLPSSATGLYRIRATGGSDLLYIGQGLISSRLRAHLHKRRDPEHAQGRIFAASAALECSTVLYPELYPHQLLELENDLIGAHVLHYSMPPAAQFLG